MRAVEVGIVFEDDDGRKYVATEKGAKVDLIVRHVAPLWELVTGEFPGELIGPVLRKVTEVEGTFDDFGDDGMIVSVRNGTPDPGRGGNGGVDLMDLVPDWCLEVVGHDEIGYTKTNPYRYRFTCEAVRVPDPEKDAKEISGLPTGSVAT